jgi:hypothetical protein
MANNNNRSVPSKKVFTLSLSEKGIEEELCLIFDSQIYPECEQDHSFKNSFESVRTSIDDFLAYLGNRVSKDIPIVEVNTQKKVLTKR